jgi:hypothetical protein
MKKKTFKNSQGHSLNENQKISASDSVKPAATAPEVLKVIGEESAQNGTDGLTTRQIDRIITAARARKTQL